MAELEPVVVKNTTNDGEFTDEACAALDAIGFERGCGSAFSADDGWPMTHVIVQGD